MKKIAKDSFNKEFDRIKEYFNLPFIGTIDNKNSIDTEWGEYVFFFDKDSIMGRFNNLDKDKLPPQMENLNGNLVIVTYYPNLFSGKMNFHFEQVFDFINTFDRIFKIAKGA